MTGSQQTTASPAKASPPDTTALLAICGEVCRSGAEGGVSGEPALAPALDECNALKPGTACARFAVCTRERDCAGWRARRIVQSERERRLPLVVRPMSDCPPSETQVRPHATEGKEIR